MVTFNRDVEMSDFDKYVREFIIRKYGVNYRSSYGIFSGEYEITKESKIDEVDVSKWIQQIDHQIAEQFIRENPYKPIDFD